MEVYYFTILIILFLGLASDFFQENNAKLLSNISKIMVILILVFVSGLRWNTGTDYIQYSINYDVYKNSSFSDLLFEPGIKIIAKISQLIYDDYFTMFLIGSLITVSLFVIAIIKNNKSFTFGILLFILMGFFHGSFNGVRQYLACSIIIIGHTYILKRDLFKYILIIILASMFHFSALFSILFYFIYNYKINFKFVIITISIMALFYILNPYIINIFSYIKYNRPSTIDSDYFSRNVNFIRILIRFSPLIIYILYTDKTKLNIKDKFYIKLIIINAFLSLFTLGSAYMFRLTIYTNSFSLLGYPVLFNNREKMMNVLLKIVVIVLFFIYWYIEVFNSPDLNPYRWIFSR